MAGTVCAVPPAAWAAAKKKPMNEVEFWALVSRAKRAAGPNVDARPVQLEILLASLPLTSIQAFQRRYEAQLLKASRWSLWGAAYVMNGGCSDDGFKYFRDWLISEGKERFDRSLADPDSLADVPRREYLELERYGYAATKAFEKKGGGALERDFQVEIAAPIGKERTEPELPALYPRLAAAYGLKS